MSVRDAAVLSDLDEEGYAAPDELDPLRAFTQAALQRPHALVEHLGDLGFVHGADLGTHIQGRWIARFGLAVLDVGGCLHGLVPTAAAGVDAQACREERGYELSCHFCHG